MRATPRARRLLVITYALVLAWGIYETRDIDSETGARSMTPALWSGKATERAEPRLAVRGQEGAASSSPAPSARASRASRHRGSLNWAALAECESSGNPRAVSPSGRYMGLYQFDLRTWRSVGGSGYPHHASPAEQTLRAQLLYTERGRQPWPVCGRRL